MKMKLCSCGSICYWDDYRKIYYCSSCMKETSDQTNVENEVLMRKVIYFCAQMYCRWHRACPHYSHYNLCEASMQDGDCSDLHELVRELRQTYGDENA